MYPPYLLPPPLYCLIFLLILYIFVCLYYNYRLQTDSNTGKSKGFAFCEYEDASTATSAISKLNNADICGRRIKAHLRLEHTQKRKREGLSDEKSDGDQNRTKESKLSLSETVENYPHDNTSFLNRNTNMYSEQKEEQEEQQQEESKEEKKEFIRRAPSSPTSFVDDLNISTDDDFYSQYFNATKLINILGEDTSCKLIEEMRELVIKSPEHATQLLHIYPSLARCIEAACKFVNIPLHKDSLITSQGTTFTNNPINTFSSSFSSSTPASNELLLHDKRIHSDLNRNSEIDPIILQTISPEHRLLVGTYLRMTKQEILTKAEPNLHEVLFSIRERLNIQ